MQTSNSFPKQLNKEVNMPCRGKGNKGKGKGITKAPRSGLSRKSKAKNGKKTRLQRFVESRSGTKNK